MFKNSQEKLVESEDEVELSKAELSAKLSSSDLDSKTGSFHVTADRILFQSPYDVIGKVLQVNGFEVNLENIIACIDETRFGAKVKLSGKGNEHQPVASEMLPCLFFSLPKKSKVGTVLNLFYEEIRSYEAEISRLQLEGANGKNGKKASPEQLQKKIDSLKEDNLSLKQKIDVLSQKLASTEKSHASANRTIESQNLLPPNMRIAKVRGIDIKNRVVNLKSGRTSIDYPMADLLRLPVVGEQCLVQVEKGKVFGAFFFDNEEGQAFNHLVGTVLSVSHPLFKVRDDNRKVHVLKSLNPTEDAITSGLKRGDRMFLSMVGDQIVGFKSMAKFNTRPYLSGVQEKIVIHQLQQEVPAGDLED